MGILWQKIIRTFGNQWHWKEIQIKEAKLSNVMPSPLPLPPAGFLLTSTHGQSINLSFANHQDLLPKVIKAKYFPYMLRMNNNLSIKTSMLFSFLSSVDRVELSLNYLT